MATSFRLELGEIHSSPWHS